MSTPVLFIFSEDYSSPNVIDPSLTLGTNFNVSVQASGLPAIVDQSSGGLEGFDVSVSYNSSVLRPDWMSFAAPLCPYSDGCIFDTPLNNTLTYQNSTSIALGTARLAMIGLGASHRANNSTRPGLPPILFRIRFSVVGKGVTPIAISQSSQLIGYSIYSSNSCSLVSYQLTSTSNGSFDNRPPFTLSANPPSLSIAAGSSGSTTVFVNATRPDVPANATLTLSGLVPPPINGTFTFSVRSEIVDSTNPSFTSTLGISIKANSKPGTYILEIVAVNGLIPGDPFQQFRLRFNLTITGAGYAPASPYSSPVQSSIAAVIPPSALSTGASTPPVIVTFTVSSSPIVGTRVSFVPTVWCGTPPYGYAWSFGDGVSSTNKSATHTFSHPGNYNVTLTITDSAGQIFISSQMIRVAAQPAPVPPAHLDTSGLLAGIILVLLLVVTTSFVILRRRRKPRR